MTPSARPPYAAPLSAVDSVTARHDGDVIELAVVKDIVDTDPYLAGHFPRQPIYPGVFIIETVRQAVLGTLGERDGRLPDISAVRSLRFTSALRPGDQLHITARLHRTAGPPAVGGKAVIPVSADCTRADGSTVARLALEFRYDLSSDVPSHTSAGHEVFGHGDGDAGIR